MAEEKHSLEITDIRIFEASQLGGKPKTVFLVEYLLDQKIAGVLQIDKADYSKDEVFKRVLALEKAKHPDIGETLVG